LTDDFTSDIDGGGWQLIRHVPAGNVWHPATDSLAGTDVYGDSSSGHNSNEAWSVNFESPPFDQFLFATGDEEKWLIATRDAVTGAFYKNKKREVVKSSINSEPHTVAWYRRRVNLEDPWVSLTDHHPAINSGNILYGANSFGQNHATKVLPMHQGANVFVRQSGVTQNNVHWHWHWRSLNSTHSLALTPLSLLP
jgi:hypothetical protein